MKKHKIYKNKYLIGIYKAYEDDDSLVTLVDNLEEFAEFMEIKKTNAKVILNKAFKKQIKYIRFNGCLCNVVFIPNSKL